MTSTQSQTNPHHQRRTTKWFDKSHIVAIGINKYNSPIASLNTAVNDARKIAHILKQDHGFEEQYFLLNEKATLKNIKLLLNNIKKIIKKSDRLIFYFAGHGIAIEKEKPQGYLIPQDAVYGQNDTYLSMNDLINALQEVNCRHGLIILDCCYAGAIKWSGVTRQSGRAKTIYPTTLDTYIDRQAWHILTSSDEHQEANDVLLEKNLQENNRDSTEQKHSPFAKCLIEGLGSEADVYPQDDIITVQELALYLHHNVDAVTAKAGSEKRQTPQLLPFPEKHKNGQFVFLLNNLETIKNNLPSNPEINDRDNPYRGLESYDEEHKDVFFGRNKVIEELCQKVHSSRLTVVLGASGSGKSSLVKAGLIPRLKQTDKNQWLTRVMRPDESPIAKLETILNDKRFNSALTSKDGRKCLLVIDQFEELVTQCRDKKEREKFWLKFVSLIEKEYQNLHIVVTLRSDFESTIRKQFEKRLNKPISAQPTNLNWIDARFLVKPIEPQQLKEVIKSPAETKAVDFTEEQRDGRTLVQQLIHEVTGMPGALPLLSFALQEIYHELAKRFNQAEKSGENLPKREIVWDDYDKLKGGVPQSISRRATEEYNSLGIDDEGNELGKVEKQARQTMLKWIMLRMVTMTGDGLARRRVSMSELKYPEPNNKYVDFVIERFVNARLLTRGETETDTFVEPSHDALIREWTKINDWLSEEFNVRQISWLDYSNKVLIGSEYKKTFFSKFQKTKIDLQMQKELTTASSNWLNNQKTQGDKKAVGFLWNEDPRLPFLYYIVSSGSNWFNKAETDFIKRSEQKRQNDLCRIVSGIILAIASTSFFAVWTSYNGQQASLRAKAANVRNLTSDKPFDALFLAWEAVNQPLSDSVVEVRSSLLSAVETPKERNRLDRKSPVPFVAVLKDEQIVSSTENEILIWDNKNNWDNKSLWQSDNNNEIVSLDVCFNDLVFGTNNQNNNFQVYYLPDLKPDNIEQLPIKNNFTKVFAVSYDCEIIAVGDDSQVQLLNKQGQNLGEPFYENNVTAVAISPDLNYIAMANNDEYTDDIKVQKIPYSSKENSVSHSQQNVEGLKSNTNTSSVKTVSLSFFSQTPPPLAPPTSIPSNKPFFNETSPATKPPLDKPSFNKTPPPLYIPLEVAPDPCYDSASQKFVDCNSNLIPFSFNHGGEVSTIAFSPDSKRLVSGDSDGTLRFWNIDNAKQIDPPLERHDGAVTSIAFSPDGTFIVSGSRDNSLRLWDINGNQIAQPLQGHESWVRDVTVTSDAKSIISSSNDGTIRSWDVNKENLINLSTQNNESIQIKEVALSKDGRVVVTNDGYPISRYRVASDNDNFAQNCTDGEYRLTLWSKGKFAQSRTSEFHSCEINAIATSDDGKISVSGGADGKIILWDEEGNSIDFINQENREVTAIAIASNGQSVVSGTRDGKIQLWQIKDQKLAKSPKLIECDGCEKRVSAIAFSNDGKLIASGSHDNIVRLWNTKGKLIKEFKGHTLPIESIAFSHNKKFLASGSQDNTVRLWKTKTNIVDAIAGLWNKEEHKQKQFGETLQGHKGWISAIAFSPDDQFIATGSWDNTVRLWDSFGNLMGSPFKGHTEWIGSIRFSSDGKSIISGSADKTIRCWQAGDPQDWLKKAEEQLQDHSNSPNFGVFDSLNNDNRRKSLNICQEHNLNISKSFSDSMKNFTTPTRKIFLLP